jgi:hypothetical protein
MRKVQNQYLSKIILPSSERDPVAFSQRDTGVRSVLSALSVHPLTTLNKMKNRHRLPNRFN